MYNELVKRLRHSANFAERGLTPPPNELRGAADAIEELSAIRDEQKAHIILMAAEIEEQQPHWIPVKEMLPEDECPVLVTYLGFHDHKPRANMLAYIDRDLGWCWWDDDIPGGVPCSVEITHWQPMPEPPKEE